MDVNLEHLDYQEFEDLCNDLLRQEVGGVTSIDGSGGDQGVDGFKGKIEDEVTIYQHKFYTGRLDYNKKQKILSSFETAKEKHPNLKKWVLLIALEFTHTEQEWFEEEITQSTTDIETKCWNKKEIEDKTCKHEHLVHRYFPTSMLSTAQRHQQLLNYLSGSVVEKGEILQKRLEKLQDENPQLDVDYEFSSIDDTHRLYLKPGSGISVSTELDIDDKKTKKIQNKEKVQFSQEEIDNIEFEPEILPNDELEPSELIVKPWYEDWEKNILIEIPGSGFKKEFTIVIEDISDELMVIKTDETVFGFTISYAFEDKKTEINLSPKFEGVSVHRISEFLSFIEEFKTHNRILMRDLNDDTPIFSGEITSTQGFEGDEWFRDIISRLELIESHTGMAFSWSEEIDEEEEIDIIIASDLITDGETSCPYSITGEIIEGKEKELLRIHDEDDFTEAKVELDDFYVDIMGKEVDLGSVVFVYPDPELVNADEIREKMGQSDPVKMEIQPSEEAVVRTVEE